MGERFAQVPVHTHYPEGRRSVWAMIQAISTAPHDSQGSGRVDILTRMHNAYTQRQLALTGVVTGTAAVETARAVATTGTTTEGYASKEAGLRIQLSQIDTHDARKKIRGSAACASTTVVSP